MTSKSSKLAATVVSGHTFTVDTRYDLKDSKILGRGSYGVVTTATDKLQHGKIAIKRIRPFANDEWDARHTLREIRLLKLLGPHPNVRRCATITNMFSFCIRVTHVDLC
jgi:serine/threonine protein kinase